MSKRKHKGRRKRRPFYTVQAFDPDGGFWWNRRRSRWERLTEHPGESKSNTRQTYRVRKAWASMHYLIARGATFVLLTKWVNKKGRRYCIDYAFRSPEERQKQ